ncbi:MAG: hypothetical protein K0Q87_2912 [Neobacillus sp.]|jgi:hypothetical protein|nr:hypothetical protein [Neobacillus sp.]
MTIEDFILPFSGSLSAANHWVRLAKVIPWDEIEKEYLQAETVAQAAQEAAAEKEHNDNDDHDAHGNGGNSPSLATATSDAKPKPNQEIT